MKVLITGGAGFIGSHLAQRLLEQGCQVVVVDNLSTGSLRNIRPLESNPGFTFILEDICNEQTMHVLIQQCDMIYHLAAAVGVQLIVDNPVRTIETNIHGSEIVLAIANKFRKKVLLASTSEVYGKSEQVPFHEDHDTVLGSTRFSRWSYACSKAIDEFLGLAYYEQYGLPVIVARFFNTVGPRQTGKYGMVVPRFIQWALRNEPIRIYGSGRQSRCFCHVEDVVTAVIKLMQCPQAPGRVYNIGSQEEITIENLADKIIAMTDSKSQKIFVPYETAYGKPFDDMQRRVPSLDRIRETIGYKNTKGINEILADIIQSFKEERDH
jgi:UDP-glucose 4-epimerase